MADKTVISIDKPTPAWATWAFRIVFVITTALSIWIASTKMVSDANKVEIMVAFKAFDFVIWGIGRGLGVKKEDYDTDYPNK